MAGRARSPASVVAAFQSAPRLRERRRAAARERREPPFFPFPPSQNILDSTRRISTRRRMEQLRAAATGWINSETLNLLRVTTTRDGDRDDETADGGQNGSPRGYDGSDGDSDAKLRYPSPSSVERLLIRDRLVYVKRDDALHLPGSNVSGNKARKFLALNEVPAGEFPDVVVSYGGPQSNAMLALAAIVSSKNAELLAKGGGEENDRRPPSQEDGEEEAREDDIFWQLDVSDEETDGRKNGYGGGKKKEASRGGGLSSSLPTEASPEEEKEKKRFVYYTKTMPRYLRKNPNGNLLRAMALGAEIRTLSHDEYERLFGGLHGGSAMAPADLDPPVPGRSLWMPQGGACGIATRGSDVLAGEIVDYWTRNGRGMPLAVCVPGGTCTTALLLHRSIGDILEERRRSEDGKEKGAPDIRLIVIPCVGDDEYAMRQMMSLDRSVGGMGRREDVPCVLRPRSDVEYGSARRRSKGYFRFGEPAKAILQTYDEMNGSGLFLDLLYGAPAWSLLLQHWRSRDLDCPIAGRQVMYVHSGGLEGVASQLTRYKHKGLMDARTIQVS